MTLARTRWRWSGGKSRVGGPAADDADRPLELDPVRVDPGRAVAAVQIKALIA
jgi:hypothetical protein